jgi:hypothetical protein
MSDPRVKSIDSVDDLPAGGKSEIDVTGSSSNSDHKIYKNGFISGEREGVTFVSRGVGKDFYRPVDSYEGLHRYDPDFDWEPEEEKRVVRKVLSNGTMEVETGLT